jgi:hypothetical protein
VPAPLKKLHGAFMLFGRGARGEGPQIAAAAGFRILLQRIEAIATRFELADHYGFPKQQLMKATLSSEESCSMARKTKRKWSGEVTKHSHALDLEPKVFTWKNPKRIALSLKRSAEASRARKASAFRSALSMLTFYINRAGKGLSAERRKTLQQAKDELRKQFGVEEK